MAQSGLHSTSLVEVFHLSTHRRILLMPDSLLPVLQKATRYHRAELLMFHYALV